MAVSFAPLPGLSDFPSTLFPAFCGRRLQYRLRLAPIAASGKLAALCSFLRPCGLRRHTSQVRFLGGALNDHRSDRPLHRLGPVHRTILAAFATQRPTLSLLETLGETSRQNQPCGRSLLLPHCAFPAVSTFSSSLSGRESMDPGSSDSGHRTLALMGMYSPQNFAQAKNDAKSRNFSGKSVQVVDSCGKFREILRVCTISCAMSGANVVNFPISIAPFTKHSHPCSSGTVVAANMGHVALMIRSDAGFFLLRDPRANTQD